jgi:hypothetical protein
MTLPLNDPYSAINPSHAFISVETPHYQITKARALTSGCPNTNLRGLKNIGGLIEPANCPPMAAQGGLRRAAGTTAFFMF